ncbi:hypothetical protein BH09BAC3_BH09BAC3_21560 [soil metagenome]
MYDPAYTSGALCLCYAVLNYFVLEKNVDERLFKINSVTPSTSEIFNLNSQFGLGYALGVNCDELCSEL